MARSRETEDRRIIAPRTACLSILAFWAFYFAVNTLRSFVADGSEGQWRMIGQRVVVSLICGGATLLFYLALRRAFSASLRRNIVKAAILAVPAAFLYSSVNYAIFDRRILTHPITITNSPSEPMTLSFGVPEPGDDMTPFQSIVGNAVSGYFYFATWAALFLLLCYGVEVRALERRAAALRAAAQSAELRALRYQVNPHFLFNTLNALSSLVLARRNEAAERMIAGLAAFFRTSMSDDPTADVPLSEEIFLQRLYLEIEAVRFPDRLAVTTELPEDLRGVPVPGLILQPLIENAVKHGVARSRRRVTIRIAARREEGRLLLSVEDDGDAAAVVPDPDRNGLGLRNVRDRLAARYGEAAGFRAGSREGGGYVAELVLPIGRHAG